MLNDPKNRKIQEAFEKTAEKESGKVQLNEQGKDDAFVDEIGKFYIVTVPTVDSELGDHMYETDIRTVYYQFKGGLDIDEIVLVTKNENLARDVAQEMKKKMYPNPEEEKRIWVDLIDIYVTVPWRKH